MDLGIASNITGFLISGGLGFLGTRLAYRFRHTVPARKRWRFEAPKGLTVVVSESESTDTGKYTRHSTGAGQVRALALISPDIMRGYKSVNLERVRFASEPLREEQEQDLLVLGGVKTNKVTQKMLQRLGPRCPISMEKDIIIWNGVKRLEGDHGNGTVKTDYGFVISVLNPRARPGKPRRLIIIAGGHTYGTVAAARWFLDAPPRDGDFAVVVEAEVDEYGHACPLDEPVFEAKIPPPATSTIATPLPDEHVVA